MDYTEWIKSEVEIRFLMGDRWITGILKDVITVTASNVPHAFIISFDDASEYPHEPVTREAYIPATAIKMMIKK